MRALNRMMLIALVLALSGTVMPVYAGRQQTNAPRMELYWRYQVPKPRPDATQPPETDRVAPVAPAQSMPFARFMANGLRYVLLSRVNGLTIW